MLPFVVLLGWFKFGVSVIVCIQTYYKCDHHQRNAHCVQHGSLRVPHAKGIVTQGYDFFSFNSLQKEGARERNLPDPSQNEVRHPWPSHNSHEHKILIFRGVSDFCRP